jgi:hypothetical protein
MKMPYIATLSNHRHFRLYEYVRGSIANSSKPAVVEITSLYADESLRPVSISLQETSGATSATIIYNFCQIGLGWCVGLQEFRLESKESTGCLLSSRFTFSASKPTPRSEGYRRHDSEMPSTLSYSHPYLIAALPDNTAISYLVTSNSDSYHISPGKRLWGHSSAVSLAECAGNGKAISISVGGDNIRVWDLRDALSTPNRWSGSTEISPPSRDAGQSARPGEPGHELLNRRYRWISFDDEQVVVLSEQDGRQIMSCFDFL